MGVSCLRLKDRISFEPVKDHRQPFCKLTWNQANVALQIGPNLFSAKIAAALTEIDVDCAFVGTSGKTQQTFMSQKPIFSKESDALLVCLFQEKLRKGKSADASKRCSSPALWMRPSTRGIWLLIEWCSKTKGYRPFSKTMLMFFQNNLFLEHFLSSKQV